MKTKLMLLIMSLVLSGLLLGGLWALRQRPAPVAAGVAASPLTPSLPATSQLNTEPAITAFEGVPVSSLTSACYVPYFSTLPGSLPPTLHVMNPRPVSQTITFTVRDMMGTLLRQTPYNLDPQGSMIFVAEDFSENAQGSASIQANPGDGAIACLVKHAPALETPPYLAAYTPLPPSMSLAFPWLGSARDDLHSLLALHNTSNAEIDITLSLHKNSGEVISQTWLLGPHTSIVYPPPLMPGEFAAAIVEQNGTPSPILTGYLAQVTADDVPVEIWSARSLNTMSNQLLFPSVIYQAEGLHSSAWIMGKGLFIPTQVAINYLNPMGLVAEEEMFTLSNLLPAPAFFPLQALGPEWYGSAHFQAADGAYYNAYVLQQYAPAVPGADLAGYVTQNASEAGPFVYLPAVHRYPGHATAYWVRAAQSTPVSVTFTIYDMYGAPRFRQQRHIPPNGVVVWDQADMPALGLGFDGSAIIAATDEATPIVVVGYERTFDSAIPDYPTEPYEFNQTPYEAYWLSGIPTIIEDAYIGWPNDRDWYKIEITEPSLLTVTLTNIPVDYELMVIPHPGLLPFLVPNQNIGQLIDPFQTDENGGIESIGGWSSGDGWGAIGGWSSGDGWGAIGGWSSGDGWGAIGGATISSNPYTQTERVRLAALRPGAYYILVTGADETAFDPEFPYTLAIETGALPGALSCTWTPTYTVSITPQVYWSTAAGANPLTLILYHPTRMAQTYGTSDQSALTALLQTLSENTLVRGVVYPIELDNDVDNAYNGWNNAYCQVQPANAIVDHIRENIIAPYLEAYPSIRYIVVVGSDEQIPFYREWDFAKIANERTYAQGALAEPSAILAATARGYYLTDDAYGTPVGNELGWRGRYFWRPTLAVGRLVETPDEMGDMVGQFLSDNTLNSTDALVTGYDFLMDSGDAIATALSAMHSSGNVNTLISDSWHADDLRTAWTNRATAPSLVSVNAHFDHWRGLPASPVNGFFYNSDVTGATANLAGTVAWSMGCHAGYNVPDTNVTHAPSQPDFPQAFAQRGATWIANTGYGYGMYDGIGGSERVMFYFTQELGRHNSVPIGMALRNAKARYLGQLPPGGLTPYDAKSIMEATLYGLPMYLVDTPNTLPLQTNGMATQATTSPMRAGFFSQTLTIQPTLVRYEAQDGVYYGVGSAAGAHGTTGRPLLPAAAVELDPLAGTTPHGALLLFATLESHADFDPVISRPVTDTRLTEPPLLPDLGWFPSRLFTINRAAHDTARLTGIFALFNARSAELRLLTRAQVRVLYAPISDEDFTPPAILAADLRREGAGFVLEATVEDDRQDVTEVYFTFISKTGISSFPLVRDPRDPAGLRWIGYQATLPTQEYLVQAMDASGNVAIGASKGNYLQAEPSKIYLPLVMRQ